MDAVARLARGTPDERARGRRLGGRYLPGVRPPDGPDGDAAAAAWVAERRAYLFASNTGDYRRFADPLPERRGGADGRVAGEPPGGRRSTRDGSQTKGTGNGPVTVHK